MKICFPVEEDKGLESEVFGHFGSAPLFVVYDTDDESISTINNQDLGHVHGKCNPLKALNGKMVDAVIVGGIGAGAITKLNGMGIKVYKASEGNIKINIDLFKTSGIKEMNIEQTCGGNIGGCIH
ncbi:MAG: diguanylate cyclase [Desulfobacterales bacterium]|nr:diguanylate cyclase [Desulfobacterales bacterium]MCP4161506.1 diguanylate cyclase [Deltaproteobacteria bacterium]